MSHDDQLNSATLLNTFQSAIQADKRYCDGASTFVKEFLKHRLHRIKNEPLEEEYGLRAADRDVLCSGSSAEYTAICRWIRNNKVNIEVDIMYCVVSIPDELQDSLLVDIEGHPGFYYVRAGQDLYNCMTDYVKYKYEHRLSEGKKMPELKTGKYVNAIELKRWHLECIHFRAPPKNEECNGKTGGMKFLQQDETIEGPSACLNIDFSLPNGEKANASIDNVMAISLGKIPEIGKSFFDPARRKNWPTQDVVQMIMQDGCHLVAKSPSEETADGHEWRLSFSMAEKHLARCRTDLQQTCYLITKSIFYVHIKIISVNDKSIFSFALKTCMLWMLEETEPSEWNSICLYKHIDNLLGRLEIAVTTKSLPNFFIPQINLVQGFSDELLQKVAACIKEIRTDIMKFIPHNLSSITKEVERVIALIDLANLFVSTMNMMNLGQEHRERQSREDTALALGMGFLSKLF